ncbi:MAG TPA: LPS export ABC transporter periplasmic protein LptC [Terriglobia bacterium]|nr:LPS export ABC transporter periplasmic protein LptC [Terriglobia bacterium]
MNQAPLGQQEQRFDSRKRRISRLLAIILCVTVAAIVAGLWTSFHRRKTAVTRPPALPHDVNRRLSGYTFTRSEEGRQIFTIHAARTLAYGQGTSTVLEDVHVIVFGRSGNRHDEIQTARCRYNNTSGALACSGRATIKLESQPGLEPATDLRARQPLFLETSNISYDPSRSEVTTAAPVDLRFGPARGSALGLTYNTRDGSLALLKNVRLDFPPASGRALAIQISAGGLTYQKPSNQVDLQSPVAVTQGARRLKASAATIFLNAAQRATRITFQEAQGMDDLPRGRTQGKAQTLDASLDPATESLRRLVATGAASLQYFEKTGAERRLTAEKMEANFSGTPSRPVSGSASGNFQLVFEPAPARKTALLRPASEQTAPELAASERTLRGSELQFKLRPGGVLDEAHTVGPGEIQLIPAKNAGWRQTITAGQFLMAFGAEGRLKTLRGFSSTRIVDQPPPNAPRGVLARESSAERLKATIDPATEAIQTLRQQGNFQFREGDRRASADAAVYESQGQRLTLLGHPEVWDPNSRIRAQHMTMNPGTGIAKGWGKVESVHFDPIKQPAPGSKPVQTQDDPIIVLADRVTAARDSQVIHYEGNVRAWRGANVVESSSLDISKKQERLTSGYGVVTSLMQSGGRAAHDGSSKATHGAAQPMTIRADRLIYFDLGRKAVYQGHARMKSENTTFDADQIEIYFSKSSPGNEPEVERAVANGHVRITQLPGRHGSGEHAEYFAPAGKIVLTGGPPFVYDEQQGFLTGQRLTFFIHDASLFADGGKKSQTLSKRRILQQ